MQGTAQQSAMMKVLCLADSTAYGFMEGSTCSDGAGVVQEGTTTVVCSCGGSLVKPGNAGFSIMRLFNQHLQEAVKGYNQEVALPPDDAMVSCRAIPARDSVPNRHWQLLEEHRRDYGLAETSKTILELCRDDYNRKSKLHFKTTNARDAMQRLIDTASEEILHGKPDDCIAVVICAGWNVDQNM